MQDAAHHSASYKVNTKLMWPVSNIIVLASAALIATPGCRTEPGGSGILNLSFCF